MKYIFNNPWTKTHLEQWKKHEKLVFAGFFFHNRGTFMQKSQTGLLRSILHQILTEVDGLIPLVFPDLWRRLKLELLCENDFPSTDPSLPQRLAQRCLEAAGFNGWTRVELRKASTRLLQQRHTPIDICILIDGLDEFEAEAGGGEGYDDLIDLIRSMDSPTSDWLRVKICLSSRPLNVFQDAFRKGCTIRLQDLTKKDINIYLTDRLRSSERLQLLLSQEGKDLSEFVKTIECRADGVFLWVRLVTTALLRGVQEGDELSELRHRVRDLPSKLEDLFMRMLHDISLEYLQEATRIFQIVTSAIRPLTLSALLFATDGPIKAIQAPVGDIADGNKRKLGCRNMGRRLRSRCAGLLEVIDKPQDPEDFTPDDRSTVQYIHQSVRDFLSRAEIIAWLSNRACGTRIDPNVCLLGSCLRQLKCTGFPTTRVWSPHEGDWVLRRDAMVYAYRAEVATCLAQTALLDEFDRVATLKHKHFRESQWLSYREKWKDNETEEVSRYHYFNCASFDTRENLYWTYDRWTTVYNRKEPWPEWRDDFLSFAMTYRLSLYVKEKITAKDFNINAKQGRPWLAYAVSNEVSLLSGSDAPPVSSSTLEMISLLLQKGASPNADPLGAVEMRPDIISPPYTEYETIWAAALAEKADIRVLQLLVQYGAQLEGWIPHSKAYCGWLYDGSLLDYVSGLIQKSAAEDARDLTCFKQYLIERDNSSRKSDSRKFPASYADHRSSFNDTTNNQHRAQPLSRRPPRILVCDSQPNQPVGSLTRTATPTSIGVPRADAPHQYWRPAPSHPAVTAQREDIASVGNRSSSEPPHNRTSHAMYPTYCPPPPPPPPPTPRFRGSGYEASESSSSGLRTKDKPHCTVQ